MAQIEMQIPHAVRLAIRYMWASFAIFAIPTAYEMLSPFIMKQDTPNIFAAKPGIFLLMSSALPFAALIVFVYFILERVSAGKNWARIFCLIAALVVLFIFVITLTSLKPSLNKNALISIVLEALHSGLAFYALFLLFTPPGSNWFKKSAALLRGNVDNKNASKALKFKKNIVRGISAAFVLFCLPGIFYIIGSFIFGAGEDRTFEPQFGAGLHKADEILAAQGLCNSTSPFSVQPCIKNGIGIYHVGISGGQKIEIFGTSDSKFMHELAQAFVDVYTETPAMKHLKIQGYAQTRDEIGNHPLPNADLEIDMKR